LYYEYSIVRTTDVQPDVILSREDEGTLAISSLRPSLVYDTRDNPFEPTRGIVAGLSLKMASYLLFSETDFLKMTLYGSTFHRLHKRIVLALSARGGIAYGFNDTDELPLVERFFLGGRFSVRGYEQDTLGPKGADDNPTGGNAFAMGSVELRTNIGWGVSIVPFLDFGNVWVKVDDFNPSDIKYTAGLGLRYSTPVGPLRVDYGFKLNKEKDESSGELHFSIGHAF
jgi:outer membrane protein insertion porin family